MTYPDTIRRYRNKFALLDRPLVASGRDGIEQVVVIPALAEKETLPATLASLARNEDAELRRTMILCIINNRPPGKALPPDIANNRETIFCLDALIKGFPDRIAEKAEWKTYFPSFKRPPLRLAYIDASSPGCEMPEKSGGVGAARKIGMDAALTLFDYGLSNRKLLICLDADTLVSDNYLAAIRNHFLQNDNAAAIVDHEHQRPLDAHNRLAIVNYEIFLRYYVLGLRYAGSPYAFHTIGSTMTCTVDAYVAVGGMNRREAAEDFYFLNKINKYGTIGLIRDATVFPSARQSHRVPFGTGKRISRFLEEREDEWLLYDPYIFSLLKDFLNILPRLLKREPGEIMTEAHSIHPLVSDFLTEQGFPQAWSRVQKNSQHPKHLAFHFHCWFDAFKTLKLIHFLSSQDYPPLNMFAALEILLGFLGRKQESFL